MDFYSYPAWLSFISSKYLIWKLHFNPVQMQGEWNIQLSGGVTGW